MNFPLFSSSTGSPKDTFMDKMDSPKDAFDDKNISADEKDGYDALTICNCLILRKFDLEYCFIYGPALGIQMATLKFNSEVAPENSIAGFILLIIFVNSGKCVWLKAKTFSFAQFPGVCRG